MVHAPAATARWRVERRRMRPLAIVMLASLVSVLIARGAAAQPAPSPSADPTARCDVSFMVRRIDATRVALSFRTGGPSRPVSGTAALYEGDRRYDIAFRNAYARQPDGSRGDVIPVVIRFPSPVAIDAAIVTSIDQPSQPACSEETNPWIASKFDAEFYAPDDAALRARTAGLVAQDAPPPVILPHACAVRAAQARTISAAQPNVWSGDGRMASVLVSLDTGDNVVRTRIVRSTGEPRLDNAALDAARRTRYATMIFNCTKLAGDYIFSVSF
jgi:TonB family protein